MAIKYKEIKKETENTPLTKEELDTICEIESYIDNIISRVFNDNPIHIDLSIARFNYNPLSRESNYIKSIRADIMHKELVKRYSNAGWKISYVLDDGLDGPNRSGSDYMILTGKR